MCVLRHIFVINVTATFMSMSEYSQLSVVEPQAEEQTKERDLVGYGAATMVQ